MGGGGGGRVRLPPPRSESSFAGYVGSTQVGGRRQQLNSLEVSPVKEL